MRVMKRAPKRAVTADDLYTRALMVPSGCMEWQDGVGSTTGYGKVRLDGKAMDAHRASWITANGAIPAGMYVCHRCDNRLCIRPAHLFLGTHADNMQDAAAKGRLPKNFPRGTDSPHAKLTEEDVLCIYRLATETDLTHRVIAARFGVDRRRVGKIARGQTWRHLSLTPPPALAGDAA